MRPLTLALAGLLPFCVVTSGALSATSVARADVPLHAFADLSAWQPNHDGGHAPPFSADTTHTQHGPAIHIVYHDQPPHWGNLVGPCHVPADAVALRFWVYKYSAAPGAAMHIWLLEPDGDCWAQQVRFGTKSLTEVGPGWHEVRMPVAGFGFQPRGRKTRQMTSVDQMLIGSNFADLEVSVADMSWETGAGEKELPLPKTADLKIEAGKLGSVGVLDLGEGLPQGFKTADPPAALAVALRAGGFGVTILKAGDLADPKVLTHDNFDAVVLPYGPYFPLGARDAFLAYLRAGGSFLSTDGYAFDSPVVLTAEGWAVNAPERTAAEMDKPESAPPAINTRTGQPGDALTLKPEQIGVFDPCFHLEAATVLRPAALPGEKPPAGPVYRFREPVAGFSACGLIGVNSAVFPDVYRRWIPVLRAYDGAGGGLRGTALSIMHNYTGLYKGSSWAFSGLTSGTDLFLKGAARRALLVRVMRDIAEKVYLHNLTSDFACYEPGETAHLTVEVSNFGRAPAERAVAIDCAGRELARERVSLQPGETKTVKASVDVDGLKTDYLPLRATLEDAAGKVADAVAAAFCLRDEKILAGGPKIGWHDNYMTVGGHPTFMVGSNQTGMMFYSTHEGPAVWERDFHNMAAHDFHILRILHFSPFCKGGYEGHPTDDAKDLVNRPKRLVRQMDAIVQLAQKHGVAIFLSLHDWVGTDLSDKDLAIEADWDKFWAARYRDVPGIFYDIQNEPNVPVPDRPDIVALWNKYLRGKYGTDEALRAAWRVSPPQAAMPDVPLGGATDQWDDVRAADLKQFQTVLLNRWVKANVDGIKAGDPNALVAVGYLPSMPPADKILGTRYTDFSNMHYYGPVGGFATAFKLIDRRAYGKGFTLGECGAREAHDTRTHGGFDVPVAASIHRFQDYLHYAVGMGAAFICNWDWKDFDEAVFPWGLMQHCSPVTKPWLHTWEQGRLLLSIAQPAYEPPQVYILVPDSNRIGPHFNQLNSAIERCIGLLLDQRVNFAMLNEEDLSSIPSAAKVIYWPLPYCPTDATFDRVLAWVKAGGTLYFSGDIAFDADRQPTREVRRQLLGLPEAPATSPFDVPEGAWGKAPVETKVGEGKVLYVPYPLELRAGAKDDAIYARPLKMAGVPTIAVEPAGAPVRALSIATRDGGRVFMLARTSEGSDLMPVTLAAKGAGAPKEPVKVELAGGGFAFVVVGPKGQVLGVESQGGITLGGARIATAAGDYGFCAVDGRDLRSSREVLVLPHQCEAVEVTAGAAGLKGAKAWSGVLVTVGGSSKPGDFTGKLTFAPGTPGEVAVVGPAGELGAARQKVMDMLTLRFARR